MDVRNRLWLRFSIAQKAVASAWWMPEDFSARMEKLRSWIENLSVPPHRIDLEVSQIVAEIRYLKDSYR